MAQFKVETRAAGVDAYLSELYDGPVRLRDMLARLGYDADAIETLHTQHLAALVERVVAGIGVQYLEEPDGERMLYLMTRRYGLDGAPPWSWLQFSNALEISRNRTRQLTTTATRRRKRPQDLARLESDVRMAADRCLGLVEANEPAGEDDEERWGSEA